MFLLIFFFHCFRLKRWGILKAMPIRITFPDFFPRSSLTLMDYSRPYQDRVAQLEQKMSKLQRKLWLWQHYRQDNLLFMIYLGCSALNRIPEISYKDVVFFNCSSQFNFSYFGTGQIFNFFLQFNQSSDFQVCINLLHCTFGSICSFPDSEVSWGVWKYFHRDLKNGKNIFTPGVCSVGSFTDCLEKLSQSQFLLGCACLPQHITVSNHLY